MKRLVNKKSELTLEIYRQDPNATNGKLVLIQSQKNVSFFEHVSGIVGIAPNEGWKSGVNLDQLAMRLAIKAKLGSNPNELEELILEDAEYAELVAANKLFAWSITDKSVLDFEQWVNKPEDYKFTSKKGK